MFHDVEVLVVLSDSITFQFPRPLSVETLIVSNKAEEILWEFIAEEFQPANVQVGTFRSWKRDEAPPEILALLAQVQDRLETELRERGPRKPPLAEIV